MNIQETVEQENVAVEAPSLKVVAGTAVTPASNVVEFKDAKQESRCENGVCTLSWKPQRKVA